ncbi:MAG TPA: sugar kinase [Burkholderiales bacterium]|nr:sugar kinase [Burkholderiales bacterium]
MTQPAILALGEPMIEFNQTRPGEPNYLQGYGGDTSNAIIACARQGAPCGYITRVGNDEFGHMLGELWREEGVDASGVSVDPAASTAVYFVTHDTRGHVFSYLRKGSAASRMTPADLPVQLIQGARFLHLSGVSQAISDSACETVVRAINIARAAGVKVAYDTNLRLKLWPLERARDVMRRAIALADYLLPGLEDMRALAGLDDPDAIIDWCFAQGARNVVLKLGGQGCIAATREQRTRIGGHAVNAVDATGAGDCFDGAFLARLHFGDDLAAAARYANAAAALATTGFGAVAPQPRREAVLAFLERP